MQCSESIRMDGANISKLYVSNYLKEAARPSKGLKKSKSKQQEEQWTTWAKMVLIYIFP